MAPSIRSEEKLAALREHGALNPRPERVSDSVFLSHDFFDPFDLVQVKYEMLRRVHTEGQSITNTVAGFGFSRQSFYQAQTAWTRSGLPGLLPRRRGPRRAHKLSEEVLEFIERTKAGDPSLRTRDLAEQVKGRFGFSLHPRSIERGLAQQQKKRAKPAP